VGSVVDVKNHLKSARELAISCVAGSYYSQAIGQRRALYYGWG